jgi:hypothetical protein
MNQQDEKQSLNSETSSDSIFHPVHLVHPVQIQALTQWMRFKASWIKHAKMDCCDPIQSRSVPGWRRGKVLVFPNGNRNYCRPRREIGQIRKKTPAANTAMARGVM